MIQSLKVTAISIPVSPTLCYAFATTVLDLAFFSFPFSWVCQKVESSFPLVNKHYLLRKFGKMFLKKKKFGKM